MPKAKNSEFYLAEGSGDEYFELLDYGDNVICKGKVIRIDRGDRVRVSVNALFMSVAEYAEFGKQHSMDAMARIDEDGRLVFSNGDSYDANGGLIEVYPGSGNAIQYGRGAFPAWAISCYPELGNVVLLPDEHEQANQHQAGEVLSKSEVGEISREDGKRLTSASE
jgi:hypothetical protein